MERKYFVPPGYYEIQIHRVIKLDGMNWMKLARSFHAHVANKNIRCRINICTRYT